MPPAATTTPVAGPATNPQNFVCPVGVNTSRPLLNQRLEALILAIGTDISSLTKAAADDRVSVAGQIAASQAQIEAEIAALVSPINDAATSGTTLTWSVDQIKLYVSQQIALITQITPSQLAGLLALAAEVNSDTGAIAAIMAILAKTVRVDMVQVFTDAEKAQRPDFQEALRRLAQGHPSLPPLNRRLHAVISLIAKQDRKMELELVSLRWQVRILAAVLLWKLLHG